jgi:hypothetical protein
MGKPDILFRLGILIALFNSVAPAEIRGAGGVPNVAIDGSGNLYVAATSADGHLRLNKYDSAGTAATPIDLGASALHNGIAAGPTFVYVGYTTAAGTD